MRHDTLNSSQEKAVRTTEGRVLVLAGAGSGKTRVIIHRIAHLIREKNVFPDTIVGLTFTNKAAKEMRERLASFIGKEKARLVTLSTFHSYCMQVLRREIDRLGYTKEFSLYDERDLDRLIGQLAKEMSNGEELPALAATKASLDEAMQSGADPKEHTWQDPFAKDLFIRLQSMLRAHNAVTFDHLIQLTIRLFEGHPDVLKKYQKKCLYLMIDEYQDTNSAQFRLAELLSSSSRNLCVVGDDDQSIYGWRGAEVQHILRFPSDHKIKLEQNYRSTPIILDAANAVIQHNKERHDKKLWSGKERGDPIEVFNAPTDVEEAQAIAERIVRLREKENLKWKEIAILYRSNVLSRQFELALMQTPWRKEGHWIRGIPYDIYGGIAFSERSEIKDLMAYLRLIANVRDEEALLRIINTPRRGISDALLDELTQANRSLNIPLWEVLQEIASGKKTSPSHPRGMNGIRSFVSLIEAAKKRFEENSKEEALLWLLETIQYKKAIEEEVKSEQAREFKWENVQECVNALAQYEQEEKEGSLQDFVANTLLQKQTFPTENKTSQEDRVQLMTLHSAKGLEFKACFIVALEDHILPHEKSVLQTGVEEERRLFYVGITRAQKFLSLSMARSRMRMGKARPTTPSRFLFEIPKHLLKATNYK